MWDLCTVLEAMKGAQFEPIHLSDMKHLALRAYVSHSSVFRQTEQLFISFNGRAKGLAALKHSLSRWIVYAIALAYTSKGVQCPLGLRAHTTRGMASLWTW